jgi:hypothetical protein
MTAALRPARDIHPEAHAFFTETLTPDQTAAADARVDELERNGNPLFREVMPEELLYVPVIADDEDLLQGTLEALAQEAYADCPSSIVIAATNSPAPRDERLFADNQRLINEFLDIFQQLGLPASYYNVAYEPGTPIGAVRADKVAAGMRFAQQQALQRGLPLGDLMQGSVDSDTLQLSRDYSGSRLLAKAGSKAHLSYLVYCMGYERHFWE